MNISEIKPGMNNIELTAKVIDISEPKQIITKFGTQTTLTVATLEDDSGKISCALWGQQADNIDAGVVVEIKNAFSKEFRNELQLGIGKGGSIKVVDFKE